MAKIQGGGRLYPLPFTTFSEIAALDLKATVYCSRCFQHRPIDPAAEHLRDRCFATTRAARRPFSYIRRMLEFVNKLAEQMLKVAGGLPD